MGFCNTYWKPISQEVLKISNWWMGLKNTLDKITATSSRNQWFIQRPPCPTSLPHLRAVRHIIYVCWVMSAGHSINLGLIKGNACMLDYSQGQYDAFCGTAFMSYKLLHDVTELCWRKQHKDTPKLFMKWYGDSSSVALTSQLSATKKWFLQGTCLWS